MVGSAQSYTLSTTIPGLLLIDRPTFSDERGFFREIERRTDLAAALHRPIRHAQWNHSRSQRGVLRGIHVAAWNKCVYVARGNAQVVVVDVRQDSPTFGQHEAFVIGEVRRAVVFVPAGCGNSFLSLTGWVDLLYSVDEEWYPGGEFGIAWNDPDLGIKWRSKHPRLSDKDQRNPTMRELFPQRYGL